MSEQEPVITVNHLCKKYGAFTAVDDISFNVQPGEIFGIVGPNGAGKTTTVECLAGLRSLDSGQVRVLGLDPHRQGRELRLHLGIQLQQASLPEDMKIWEAMQLYASFYPHPLDREKLLESWGLNEKRRQRFSSLSGGQKQRLFIALALINDPSLVLLDEITTGLDPQARRNTWEMITRLCEQGKTVVLVTHFMDEAELLCNRVAIIDHGRLMALDTPQNLIRGLKAETKVLFTAIGGDDYQWLWDCQGVNSIKRQNGTVTITGSGPVLLRVASALAERGVVPPDLRSEQANLEDVFLALTGRKIRD